MKRQIQKPPFMPKWWRRLKIEEQLAIVGMSILSVLIFGGMIIAAVDESDSYIGEVMFFFGIIITFGIMIVGLTNDFIDDIANRTAKKIISLNKDNE